MITSKERKYCVQQEATYKSFRNNEIRKEMEQWQHWIDACYKLFPHDQKMFLESCKSYLEISDETLFIQIYYNSRAKK